MAKPSNTKQSNKPVPPAIDETAQHPKDETVVEQPDAAATSKRPTNNAVKDTPAASRSKKSKAPALRQGSWMPSEQKLENLAAAIVAAGDAANLLLILNHVDGAGGPAEVIESIEAYRALKSAVEQPASAPKPGV